MSIVADIKQAKAKYEQHLQEHKCRAAISDLNDGIPPCLVRGELYEEWMATAGRWGAEPDDKDRQEDHYNRTVGQKKAAAL